MDAPGGVFIYVFSSLSLSLLLQQMFPAENANGGKVAAQGSAEARRDDDEAKANVLKTPLPLAAAPSLRGQRRDGGGARIGRFRRRRRDVIGGRIGLASRNRRRASERRFASASALEEEKSGEREGEACELPACLPACPRPPACPATSSSWSPMPLLRPLTQLGASAAVDRRP